MIETICWILPRPRKNKYKGGFPLHFEKKLIRELGFDEKKDFHRILHPFGGAAEFGIRCDINKETEPHYVADAHNLKCFEDSMFDLVILDPPYDNEQANKLYKTPPLKYKDYISDWDTELMEVHHRYKKDKPSGTALMIQRAFGREIPISSQRIGGVFGDHSITFGNDGETITLTHHAISRRTFTEGVLKSSYFAIDRERGFFTFKEVIFNGEK